MYHYLLKEAERQQFRSRLWSIVSAIAFVASVAFFGIGFIITTHSIELPKVDPNQVTLRRGVIVVNRFKCRARIVNVFTDRCYVRLPDGNGVYWMIDEIDYAERE